MKKIIIITLFLLSLTLCSCSSDKSADKNADESTTNNIDLSKVVCGETTLYDLKQLLGEPSSMGKDMSTMYSYCWLYEDVYFYNLPCDIYFCSVADNGQAKIYGYEIHFSTYDLARIERESKAYSSMIARLTEKYWTPEHYKHTVLDDNVYNTTKWDAKSNAGEKNFSYIYLRELTYDTNDYPIVTIYFTYEKIKNFETRD